MALSRQWIVRPDPETDVVEDDDAIAALLEVWAILKRQGGAVQILSRRTPDAEFPVVQHTTRLDFQWLSRSDSAPVPEPVVEAPPVAAVPEPVGAGAE